MKRSTTVLSLVVLLQCLTSAQLLAQESLTIVGDFKAQPKNWLDEQAQAQGIMIDLLNEVSKRTNIRFSYSLYPWKRAYALSEIGKGAIIGFSKSSERIKHWDYSDPMYFDELVLVTTKSKVFDFNGLKSLNGRRLAIKNGASYGDDFELARQNKYFAVTETTDRTGQMRMLTADRVDLVLVSPGRIALETVIARNDWLREHHDDFVILSPPYKSDPNFLGIPKSMNKSHLIPLINKALAAIKSDGTHKKIVERNIERVLTMLKEK